MDLDLCMDKIRKACKRIERNYAYYTPFTVYCVFEHSRDLPTIGINAKMKVSYNDIFLAELSDDEMVTVLLHEFMHVEHNHFERAQRFFNKFSFQDINIAEDMEINTLLKEKGYKNFLRGRMVLPETYGFPPLKSFEQYLALMKQNGLTNQNQEIDFGNGNGQKDDQSNGQERNQGQGENDGQQQGKGQGQPNNQQQNNGRGQGQSKPRESKQDGSSGNSSGNGQSQQNQSDKKQGLGKLSKSQQRFSSDCIPSVGEGSETPMSEERLESIIEECKQSAKEAGDGSQFVSGIIKAEKIPYQWDRILKSLLFNEYQKTIGDEYRSFSRFSRRTMAEMSLDRPYVIVRPGKFDYSYEINIAVIMDISGSMAEYRKRVYGLLSSIKDGMSMSSTMNINIYETDTEVVNVIRDYNPNLPVPSGYGGGTYMPSAWDYLISIKEDQKVDLIICITDGYTNWDKSAPLKNKSVVLYTDTNDDCPYTNYHISFEGGE